MSNFSAGCTGKPIVHYIGKAMTDPFDTSRRMLIPLDHPNPLFNDKEITTSSVVQEHCGHIETRNTRYVPVKLPTFVPDKADLATA
jgi:hypothetical protein